MWHGHFPVHHTEGGPVLEFPVFSPFHADETAAENREPGIARKHDCLRVSHRVILCRRVVPEFLCTEQSAHEKRCVGGDAVNPECNHCLDVSFLVDCPYIDAHPEGLGFLHPFRMGIEDLVMIVNSVDAVLVKICRGDVAVQILVGELRRKLGNPAADIHAERDEHHPGRVIEPVSLEAFESLVHHEVLPLGIVLLLELDNEHCGRAFDSLCKIFVEGRHRLAVGQLVLPEERIGVLVDVLALDMLVMVHHDAVIRSNVDVELAAPATVVLGGFQGGDGIFRPLGRLAIPESSVGRNPYASCPLSCGREHHHCHGCGS